MKNEFKIGVLIFVLAFIIRLCFFIFIIDKKFPLIYGPDSWDYEIFAYNVVFNKVYSNIICSCDEKLINNLKNAGWNGETVNSKYKIIPTVGREPGYPLFLGLFYYILGYNSFSHYIFKIFQIIISSFVCVLIFLLAKNLFDFKYGVLASLISCFYPHLIYYSSTISRETLLVFLSSLIGFLIYLIYNKNTNYILYTILVGVLTGYGCLINTIFFSLVIFILLFFLSIKKIKNFIYFLIIVVIIYSPWIVRNYLVFDKPVVGATVGAITFYMGVSSDYSTLGTEKSIDWWENDYVNKKAKEIFKQKGELEMMKFYYNESIKKILNRPLEYFYRLFVKLWRLYKIFPHRGRNLDFGDKLLTITFLFSYGLLFPFFIYSSLANLRNFKNLVSLYLPLISITFVYILSFCQVRHRLPIEPYIIIFAVYGIIKIYEKLTRKQTI